MSGDVLWPASIAAFAGLICVLIQTLVPRPSATLELDVLKAEAELLRLLPEEFAQRSELEGALNRRLARHLDRPEVPDRLAIEVIDPHEIPTGRQMASVTVLIFVLILGYSLSMTWVFGEDPTIQERWLVVAGMLPLLVVLIILMNASTNYFAKKNRRNAEEAAEKREKLRRERLEANESPQGGAR